MKEKKYLLVVFILFVTCKTTNYDVSKSKKDIFPSIVIDTLFQDKISIRAIQVDKNRIWYAADRGRYGYYDLDANKKIEYEVRKDSMKIEFRSIAQTNKHIYILNVGNPALLYQIAKDTKERKIVYEENHEKVFYDSMQFWDENEGIAMGDPIDSCLNVIVTKDGGNTWNKISCGLLPSVQEGEAAFAASNTNIIVDGDATWIVSGGEKSRIFYSADRGKTWTVTETPIVQGKTMTGIFTADFYNRNLGIIAGGDYEKRDQNFGNKAVTNDGGKTWKLIAENQHFGYASCVQYVPASKGKGIVSIGFSGLFYSDDSGNTWKKLSGDATLNTLRFINKNTAVAAGQNKMIRIRFSF